MGTALHQFHFLHRWEAGGVLLQVGYPVLLKATGGGGGIGIYICHSKEDLVKNFETAGR